MCWCVNINMVLSDSCDVRIRRRGSLAVRLMCVGVLTWYYLTAVMSESEGVVH